MAKSSSGASKGANSTNLYQMAFKGWLSALVLPVELPALQAADMFGIFVQAPDTYQRWRFLRLHLKREGLEAVSYNYLLETLVNGQLKKVLAKVTTLEEAWNEINQLKSAKADLDRAFADFVQAVNGGGEAWDSPEQSTSREQPSDGATATEDGPSRPNESSSPSLFTDTGSASSKATPSSPSTATPSSPRASRAVAGNRS